MKLYNVYICTVDSEAAFDTVVCGLNLDIRNYYLVKYFKNKE